jgi:hypothetical protein
MPIFRVMGYRDGAWDRLEPRVVEAQTARQAAEIICGERVMEGADRGSALYLKVWPLISSVEWFHLPSAKTAESREASAASLATVLPSIRQIGPRGAVFVLAHSAEATAPQAAPAWTRP